ncbi:pyrroline-5-carboxylate reductase [Lichenihabitans sp. PAMC28606]|uniref:pyrroline-5-carboxylate reductase n=1 Tax=Lichenihabitans sp. PAMC28606 TaxID=2880932 RepID=UPI001D0B942F|nr:pyrroline-5-carboxylate reductase [Lichenihabitans sp. PAMC28606]UDL93887.1 pyrroline-5-carboxylate reductase [Lichenihabitans sp. PAMC28606]
MSDLPRSILLAGAGKMGGALLRGWLDLGVAADQIAVSDPQASDDLHHLAKERGFSLNPDLATLMPPEILVLAVKPQMFGTVAPLVAHFDYSATVLVSVMAGKTIADMARQIPAKAIVRTIPNTPAAVGHGMTGAFANEAVTPAQKRSVHALLAAVGQVEWLDREDLIDAVTAVSGSGPAYVFLLTECLAEAAEALGLDAALSARLARATVEGAGALMAAEPTVSAEQLRRNVTSPAGTTAAALDVFATDDALRSLVTRAVAAARDRAVALGG